MGLRRKLKMFLVLVSLLHNGCIAAIPVLYTIALGLPMLTVGYTLTSMVIDAATSAKRRHPGVDYDKKWPECVAYDQDADTLFQACSLVIAGLNEEIDKSDKEKGILETDYTAFGEPQPMKDNPAQKVFYWQKKALTITKLGEKQAQVCVKALLFTTTIDIKSKDNPFEDEAAANVVRAIFFDKLEQQLKQKIPAVPADKGAEG